MNLNKKASPMALKLQTVLYDCSLANVRGLKRVSRG